METPDIQLQNERRKYRRISYWTVGRYRVTDGHPDSHHAVIENVSATGLLIKTKKQLAPKTSFTIELYIPYVKGYHLLSIITESVWQQPVSGTQEWYTGLRITFIDPRSQTILQEFVDYFRLSETADADIAGQKIHIPYWCIARQQYLSGKIQDPSAVSPSDCVIVFECARELTVGTLMAVTLKIPALTMPFDAQGIITASQEVKSGILYSISLRLVSLPDQQRDALRRFAREP